MNRMNGPATPNLVRKRSASPSARSSMPLPTTSIGHRRSEEHTSELQSQSNLVCRLLLEKKKHQYVCHTSYADPEIHHHERYPPYMWPQPEGYPIQAPPLHKIDSTKTHIHISRTSSHGA